ncbi:MAG TPA: hypothetical protein ENK49_04240 [Gammaproteobacteria bacterium]|nr:hypothetical protein [Gammaproteobacteria bacterium]
MEIRKRKQAGSTAGPAQPIHRSHAEKVRRRAEELTEPVDVQDENRDRARNHQRQQAERQMAKLRSDAVQARRLAEHIENLSQGTAAYKRKRKHVMTDSTIVDSGHAQRLQRRAQDRSASGGKQMNFNPLHPSMELPPEQLIRLLGMESKKIRKSRPRKPRPLASPMQTGTPQTEAADAPKSRSPETENPVEQTLSPVNRDIQYERCEAPQAFDSRRSGLLVPALVAGVVAGMVVSGYLFWFQPADTGVQKAPAPVSTGHSAQAQTRSKPVTRTAAPATTAVKEKKMNAQERADWQAAIKTREQQLHSAAQQRLAEDIAQQQRRMAAPQQPDRIPAAISTQAPGAAPAAARTDMDAPAVPHAQTATPATDPANDPAVTPTPATAEMDTVTTSATAGAQGLPETGPEPTATAPASPAADVEERAATALDAVQPDTPDVPIPPEPADVTPAPVEAMPAESGEASPPDEATLVAPAPADTEPAIAPLPETGNPAAEGDDATTMEPVAAEPTGANTDERLF